MTVACGSEYVKYHTLFLKVMMSASKAEGALRVEEVPMTQVF